MGKTSNNNISNMLINLREDIIHQDHKVKRKRSSGLDIRVRKQGNENER